MENFDEDTTHGLFTEKQMHVHATPVQSQENTSTLMEISNLVATPSK